MGKLCTYVCDRCGKPLDTKIQKNILGKEERVFVSYPIHPFCDDFEYTVLDLCAACASNIDLALTKFKLDFYTK